MSGCFVIYLPNPVAARYSSGTRAAPRRDDWEGGGGRGPYEVDSFHATPIGIMLNVEKFARDRSPPVPLVPPPMLGDIYLYLRAL